VPCSIARVIQFRAALAGFTPKDFAGHSLKRGAPKTGMQRGAHPGHFKRLGRHMGFGVFGEHQEPRDLFDAQALSDVL